MYLRNIGIFRKSIKKVDHMHYQCIPLDKNEYYHGLTFSSPLPPPLTQMHLNTLSQHQAG